MSVEKICKKETRALILSPKYWPLLLNFYWKSLKNTLPVQVFRASYFFCRHIDDVLDGDRYISSDPEQYVQDILKAMKIGHGGPEITELYRFATCHLVNMTLNGEKPEEHFRRVVQDAMLFDYQRAEERRVLTRQELEEYYQNTFAPVLDLALIIAGSSLRSKDIPEAISTQGHLYSIRDLDKDLPRGVINIPREELALSGIETITPLEKKDILRDSHLSRWLKKEVARHHKQLKPLRMRLRDEGSREVCLPLIHEMDLFCRLHTLGIL